MKVMNIVLATLLSACSLASLMAALSGVTHQYAIFGIGAMVAIPMWDEIYREYKNDKNIKH